MKPARLIAITVMALFLFTSRAYADRIAYVTSASMSGTVGSNSFTDAPIAVFFGADTANVITNPSLCFPAPAPCNLSPDAAVFVIFGVGDFFITDKVAVAVNQALGLVGFFDLNTQMTILDTVNPTFTTYNLTTDIGPITGFTTPDIFGSGVNTTGGILTFTSGSGTSTFAAQPEPGSLLLLGTGLSGLAWFRRRRLS